MFYVFLFFFLLTKTQNEKKKHEVTHHEENNDKLSMDDLKKKINYDLEKADKLMDFFYDMYNKEEQKHIHIMTDIIEKIRSDFLTITNDFIEILHMKMYEDVTLIQNEMKRHLSEVPRDDRTKFNEFKRDIKEYMTREEMKRKIMERNTKKDDILNYLKKEYDESSKTKLKH